MFIVTLTELPMKMHCFRLVGFVVLDFKRRGLIGDEVTALFRVTYFASLRLSDLSLGFCGVVLSSPSHRQNGCANTAEVGLGRGAGCREGTAWIRPPLPAQAVTEGIAIDFHSCS